MRTLQLNYRFDCSGGVTDSRTCDREDYCFLWCDTMQSGRYIRIYQGNMTLPSSDPL